MMTVFCDASFLQCGSAGWGAWIKQDGVPGFFKGGAFKRALSTSDDAELFAIANALAIASRCGAEDIMVQSDSLSSLNRIAGYVANCKVMDHKDGARIVPWLGLSDNQKLEALISIEESASGRLLMVRHVRGHRSGSGRHAVNNKCDEIARAWAKRSQNRKC